MRRFGPQSQTFRPPLFYIFVTLLLAFILPSSFAQQPQQQDEDEVVRVNTDLVVLNATVINGEGKYVHGLRRSDFKVLEDGREQALSDFSVEETPFAAAVLLDTSGSMRDRMSLARSAAIRFLDGLRPDDVVAIYRFDSEVQQVQDFSSSRDLPSILFGLRGNGMTSLYDALYRAAEDIARRPEKRRAIVVLSDGLNESAGGVSANKALDHALAVGATIYGINMASTAPGEHPQLGAATLRSFASKSGGRYVATPGGLALREAFAAIVEELSNQYTISYQPSNRARDGRWRNIEVRLARPDTKVRTRTGYRVPKA
jgi:Ca-activated chloride channel family protein